MSVFRGVGASPFKLIMNPIQLGKYTQAEEGMHSESSSSCRTTVSLNVTTAVAKTPGAEPKGKPVPFSCFKVLCDFFVFRMNFRGLFKNFSFQSFQIVTLRFLCV